MKASFTCGLLATTLFAACGGGQPSATGGTTCATDGDRLVMTGAFQARSRDLVFSPGSAAGSVGLVAGTDAAGKVLVMRRAADQSDAQFTAPGTFDVSMGPSVLFVRDHVMAEMFKEGFLAKRGQLTVTEVTPAFRATFHLEELLANMVVESAIGGAPIAGAVDGCIAAPPAPPMP